MTIPEKLTNDIYILNFWTSHKKLKISRGRADDTQVLCKIYSTMDSRKAAQMKKDNNSKQISGSSFLGYIPRFLRLIINLLRDPRVSATDKAILGATVAYLLNPVDIVPDWIPFLGLVDDVYLIALALLRMLLRTDVQVLNQYWDGPEELIPVLKHTAEWAVAFLPERVRKALLARIEKKEKNH